MDFALSCYIECDANLSNETESRLRPLSEEKMPDSRRKTINRRSGNTASPLQMVPRKQVAPDSRRKRTRTTSSASISIAYFSTTGRKRTVTVDSIDTVSSEASERPTVTTERPTVTTEPVNTVTTEPVVIKRKRGRPPKKSVGGKLDGQKKTIANRKAQNKDPISVSGLLLANKASTVPREERPYSTFFPDLSADHQMSIVIFDVVNDYSSSVSASPHTPVKRMLGYDLPSVERQHSIIDQPEISLMSIDTNTQTSLNSWVVACRSIADAGGVAAPAYDGLPLLSKETMKAVPKPAFSALQRSRSPVHAKRHPLFCRYVEPSEDQLAERVEYDMDEQDKAYLELLNDERKKLGFKECSEDLFEVIMDRLEKQWFDLTKDLPKVGREDVAYPDDIACAVCDDGEAENSNAIVFCDGCNLAVHQDCYGVPFIPEGQWLCRKCMISPEMPVTCVFCPVPGGAFKQTSSNRWAHLACSMWIPECHIANHVYMEPIEGIENIPKSRWKLTCYICKKRYGAPIQCSNKSCFTAFHPICARKAKLYMRMRGQHSHEPNSFRAFCDKHCPKDYRDAVDVPAFLEVAQQELESIEIPEAALRRPSMVVLSSDEESAVSDLTQPSPHKRKKVVKKLSTETNFMMPSLPNSPTSGLPRGIEAAISLTSPIIPAFIFDKVAEATESSLPKMKLELISKIAKYWALKRADRRGAPLLKRLHLEVQNFF